MATKTFLAGNSATSSNTVSVSVTPTTGRLLVAAVMIHSPFNAPTISSVVWNSNSMTSAVAVDGSGGDPYPWLGAGIFYYEVATGATANCVVTLSGSASRVSVAVYDISGYNTGAIVGDTDSIMTVVSDHVLTLTTAVGDIVIDAITDDQTAADRWFEARSGTTADYNLDPRPGTSTVAKLASGSVAASGTSTAIGWTSRGFDAGPIDVTWDTLHVAAVFQTAGAAASIVPLLHHSQRLRNLR